MSLWFPNKYFACAANLWHAFLNSISKHIIMDTHLTTVNVKDDLPLQTGNDPLSNNPAGSASIEKGKPAKKENDKPDTVTPETEKPDVHEMPKTKENPEVEKTDIEEVPDAEPEELPDTEITEIPDTHIDEMPGT
jgi:hypothetical protein